MITFADSEEEDLLVAGAYGNQSKLTELLVTLNWAVPALFFSMVGLFFYTLAQ